MMFRSLDIKVNSILDIFEYSSFPDKYLHKSFVEGPFGEEMENHRYIQFS